MSKDIKGGDIARWLLSAIMVCFGVLTMAWLFVQQGQGDISKEFFTIYLGAALITTIVGVIAFLVDFVIKPNSENLIAQAFFIFERNKLRPGSLFLPIPIIIFVLVSALIVAFVLGSNQAIFQSPDPYAASIATPLSAESLAGRGTIENNINGAVIPGLLEEGVIFFAIQATHWILLAILAIFTAFGGGNLKDSPGENPFIWWSLCILSIIIWSIGFAVAHGRFGGNQEALAFAFTFEFTMQLLNQVTGSFLSWIPHIVHNMAVIQTSAFSFVLFAVCPIINPHFLNMGISRIKGWRREW